MTKHQTKTPGETVSKPSSNELSERELHQVSGGKGYLKVTLSDILVSSYQSSGSGSADSSY